MTSGELEKFFNHLEKTRTIFGPKNGRDFGDKIFIDEINNFDDLYLGPQLPFHPFKRFFVPEEETLFEYRRGKLNPPLRFAEGFGKASQPPFEKGGETSPLTPLKKGGQIAVFGMNLLDLKSVLLYDQVFEKDPYYQARRQNMLILGHSIIPDVSQNIFEQTFEEDILEHLNFDIFLGAMKENPSTRPDDYAGARSGDNAPQPPLYKRGGAPSLFQREGRGELNYAVFTGSEKGQKVLEEFGFEDYIHIQFSGPAREGKLDARMLKIQDRLKNHHNQKIWDELGKRCIECGKCTVACPTCFCFRIDDFNPLPASPFKRGRGGWGMAKLGARKRCLDSCYYQEFSEVAGGHKFLNSAAARIHFWYFHKFGRIPEEFNFMGCVGCKRCAAVCPVGIDIGEVLKEIENGS